MSYPLLVASKLPFHCGPNVPGHKVRTGRVIATGLAGDDEVTIEAQMKDGTLARELLTVTRLGAEFPKPRNIEKVRAIRSGTSGSEVYVDVE